jgi:hypothetical protein
MMTTLEVKRLRTRLGKRISGNENWQSRNTNEPIQLTPGKYTAQNERRRNEARKTRFPYLDR